MFYKYLIYIQIMKTILNYIFNKPARTEKICISETWHVDGRIYILAQHFLLIWHHNIDKVAILEILQIASLSAKRKFFPHMVGSIIDYWNYHFFYKWYSWWFEVAIYFRFSLGYFPFLKTQRNFTPACKTYCHCRQRSPSYLTYVVILPDSKPVSWLRIAMKI